MTIWQEDTYRPPRRVERRIPPTGFRPDIEGLRAVAVFAVVLYHAGIPGTAGGFIGVDVFFVISGFLITGLLWREVSTTNTVRLGSFYGARARRLLPAAAAVAIATAIGAAIVNAHDREVGRTRPEGIEETGRMGREVLEQIKDFMAKSRVELAPSAGHGVGNLERDHRAYGGRGPHLKRRVCRRRDRRHRGA